MPDFLFERTCPAKLRQLSSELQDQIISISDASREVLHSLDEIVWAVNPQNDTLEHVASYIGQYAQEYFLEPALSARRTFPRNCRISAFLANAPSFVAGHA